ncbi:aminopeptidase N [Nocardioides ferulae]|uniref:aminopeptidase N n=1 Tax=Nocardioides ferulae TaxID=2340821 RepID=UPI001F0B8900|nr:aminopeptidase N [Nocardioides ferulae]
MPAPSQSLRQEEARTRAEQLSVEAYDVRLDLARDEKTFDSVTTVRFRSAGGPTFVDLKPLHLRSAVLNGSRLDPSLLEGGRLPLQTQVGDNELVVDAQMGFRNDGEGLHRSVDPADGRHYVYGMSFMDAAPSIFACFDQPDLKAPYTLHVTAPPDWVVVGNGRAEQVEPGVWELATTPPLSTYFVTLVAGPYHLLREEHDGIALGFSCRRSIAGALDADADELLTLTRRCFDEFHRLFGIRYPFGDYHQAFVPEFNAGAMENPGCVTFRDQLLFTSRATRGARVNRATTVAHEMAHQWFGNLVTPRWWDDLWLNESFAEYLGIRVTADVTEYADAWTDMAYLRRQWGLVADRSPTTHPVAGNGAADASSALQDFDGISYTKGSSILKQLNRTLGDEAFFGGAVDHFDRHRFGNATMHDLFASWERASGRDLSGFTHDWLRTAGPDTLSLDRAAGVLRRTRPVGEPADRAHAFRVAVHDGAGWTERSVELTGDTTPFPVGDEPVVLDPFEDTWAVVHPDPRTVAALKGLLPGLEDDQLRAAVWNAVRSAVHDAVIDPDDVVDLVVASPPIEDTEDTERRTMPWVLRTLVPLAGPDAGERVHTALLDRLDRLTPGSEQQLSAFRAAVASAPSAGLLRAWLEPAHAVPGIELDLDLRWRILVRLAVLGATDRHELDAALDAEPTNVSRVEHVRAVASLPDPEAKEFAWARFTGAAEASNYDLEAAGRGMWRPGQEQLTAPYVDRYFADLPGTVTFRSGWVLADAAHFFFPATSLTEETLSRTRALADDPEVDPSLRRRLLDQADGLARRLAVRRAYPKG